MRSFCNDVLIGEVLERVKLNVSNKEVPDNNVIVNHVLSVILIVNHGNNTFAPDTKKSSLSAMTL